MIAARSRSPRSGNMMLSALLLAAAAASAQAPAPAPAAAPPPSPVPAAPPLLETLGSYHRAVTTASPEAQRYFDQGLRLHFAFALEEAQLSFEAAARLDPACASCWWGVAMSLGPHINVPGMPDRTRPLIAPSRRRSRWRRGQRPSSRR
jgi:hypothetical protein